MKLINLLSEVEVESITQTINSLEFEDGKKTAQGFAVNIKSNKQIVAGTPGSQPIFELIGNAMQRSLEFKCFSLPKKMVGQRVNRYDVGDSYDWHVDVAHMAGVRTDMSFTLFLKPKESYLGGELELEQGSHVFSVKGQPGQVFVYPTGVRHRVTEVTEGSRLCVVGWINSFVAQAEQSDMLYTMVSELSRLKTLGVDPRELSKLQYCYQGLVRTLST